MLDFKGKICLVSGVSDEKGIGFAIAMQLGKMGGTVIMTDIVTKVNNRADELKANNIVSEAFQADLTDCSSVNKMVDIVAEKYGRIDVLINAAGWHIENMIEDCPNFSETSDELWFKKFERNFNTTYYMVKKVLPIMIAWKYGRIVNISSVIGPVLGVEGDTAYGASKAGIVGLSKSIAVEVASENITINNVLPGFISSGSQEPDAYVSGLKTPARRNGKPEEVAYLAAFLASEECSYITGQSVVIDGGSSIEMKFG